MVFMSKKNSKKKNNTKAMLTTGGLGIGLLVLMGVFLFSGGQEKESNQTRQAKQSGGDLVIEKNIVGEQAVFYPYEIEGVDIEVMAIKASDGTIRTAFNTCQICYASGRGYYEQEGNALVCQNCRNRFTAEDVQVAGGGCNPVPIFASNKIETEETISISEAFLKESKDIFLNWKWE